MRHAWLVVAAAAAACTATVDSDALEATIREELFDQKGIEADDVSCPEAIECRKNKAFHCTVRAEGGEIDVRVTQQSDDCDDLRWYVDEGTISSTKIEDTIEQAFHDRFGKRALVDCGRRHRVAVPGREFRCKIENHKGDERSLVIRVEDEAGNFSWKLE
ncbi:MAG: DUF4333 domain-containing protein [Deltaproteobacteria bacterium]|nr:MAG: DUF4333 domain-containing protein [Deltaproteobacteria bacterium]